MNTAFQGQYELILEARAALLDYCATLRPADFTAPVPVFNNSSMRDLLVHVAGAYTVWLGEVGLRREVQRPAASRVPDVAAVRALFTEVDALLTDFMRHYASRWQEPMLFDFSRQAKTLTLMPLQLFTHVVTHEFHHKGQVLSMSRQLGYMPVDTDVIRF
ncbi:DinB family protein [Hymenobacter negativus]|uniref:DinB family protein n=1 Tax=Hymenobacter negativus TaxID=2795026 RepID=A0ABS3QHJ5_9BACT|nr:DinB family protein [Hymenobacter negativus]MBO2010723.1 DinB family protein [Hymenobacter negativus]